MPEIHDDLISNIPADPEAIDDTLSPEQKAEAVEAMFNVCDYILDNNGVPSGQDFANLDTVKVYLIEQENDIEQVPEALRGDIRRSLGFNGSIAEMQEFAISRAAFQEMIEDASQYWLGHRRVEIVNDPAEANLYVGAFTPTRGQRLEATNGFALMTQNTKTNLNGEEKGILTQNESTVQGALFMNVRALNLEYKPSLFSFPTIEDTPTPTTIHDVRDTVIHEFGHVLGIDHLPARYNTSIMSVHNPILAPREPAGETASEIDSTMASIIRGTTPTSGVCR